MVEEKSEEIEITVKGVGRMNKKELIEKIKKLPFVLLSERYISQNYVLELLEQLDEPQKVVVPQFVADWYEENKDVFEANLYRYAYNIPSVFDVAKLNEFERWFLTAGTKPFQTLVNMHQFGYEVEKEPKYRISMPKARNHKNHAQILCEKDGKIFWCGEWYPFRTKFTRKQLEEADFGWVFDCEGIELEEVTD